MKKLTICFMFILFATMFLTNTAFALEESEVVLQTDGDWIVAGGNSATISVSFISTSSFTIESVDFACLQAGIYGDVVTKKVTASPYITSFSSTKSGNADIQAIINYLDSEGSPGTIIKTIQQKIDHAKPDAILNVTNLNEVTVGEVTSFGVRMIDLYGNLIDSKREEDLGTTPEYLTLYCSPVDSYLYDGTGYTLNSATVYVNSEGAALTGYQVSTKPGSNVVTIISSYGIKPVYRTITGIADSEPVSILVSVNPNNGVPPFLPADGESKFYIKYYLIDQYGNPAGNKTLDIFSSDPNYIIGERTSSSAGVVNISYGQVFQKGTYTVTAYSVDNESLRVQTDLQFDSTDPVNMLLTANPEVMPSHEVASSRTSAIRAKVIDERGNPVENEVVTFSIDHGTYPDYQTAVPSLSASSAITDENGQAIVYFTSGSFIYDVLNPNYESAGSATCNVQAEWNSIERDILLEWKNYPYLSVETEVNPETVAVNETVAVTVRLIGDGWALQPDPIDVMLSVDRSGSMLWNNPDRMVLAMDAMKVFNSVMHEGRDRVGITSFGTGPDAYHSYITADITSYTSKYAGDDDRSSDDPAYIAAHYPGNGKRYYNYASLDLPLTTDHVAVENEINNIVPVSGTPMRGSIYLGIKELVENPRDDAVRAVIVLSDGDYNWYGDPLARGSGSTSWPSGFSDLTHSYYRFNDLPSNQQDMTEYANANNIKIYTIAFGTGLSSGGVYTLEQLAERTGGTYYSALSGEDLISVYSDIAGDLQTEAGVNTQMNLDFQNVEINNVSTSNSDSSKLKYVYEYNVSTSVEKWNQTSTIIPRYTVDDTDDWSFDQSLDFDVGTVKLLETWETTFLLKVLVDGNINIFGSGSTITFNNGTDSLALPKTYITGVYNLTASGTEFKDLLVSDLHSTNTGEITDTLELEWTILYTGESSAQQSLYYLKSGDDVWIPFQTMAGVAGPLTSGITQNANLVVSDFPPGIYNIRVRAVSMDTADSAVEMTAPIKIGEHSGTYIKIE